MKMLNEHSVYRTSDIYLAATLQALGAQIEALEYENGNRCVFVFEASKDIHKASELYWRKELNIEPQTLFSSLKGLKNRLYNTN